MGDLKKQMWIIEKKKKMKKKKSCITLLR